MSINIGNLLLLIGLLFSLIIIAIYIILLKKNSYEDKLKKFQFIFGLVPFLLTFLASVYLLILFLRNNFQSVNVYNYSSSDLSFQYKISAFWAGNSGSLLLWQLVTTIIAFYLQSISFRIKNLPCKLKLYIGLIFQFKIVFFYLLLLIPANPFLFFNIAPPEGAGLNPMLQSPGMIIHPPLTFFGYAAAFVPFVIIIAGLASKIDVFQIKTALHSIRKWALFAWFFLTMGIIIGGQWAYYELGWGGYWNWDPVENASLLPWFFLTALLHGVIVFRRRKLFKFFTSLVAIGAFLLTIFATFITRSDVLDSIHAFGARTMGQFFIFFLLTSFIISLILVISRLNLLQSKNSLNNIVTCQGFILLTNITLVMFAGSVFLGIIFPIISSLFLEGYISIGSAYYNQIAIMFGGILIVLLGVCYFLSWKESTSLSSMINKKYLMLAVIFAIIGFLANIFWLDFELVSTIFRVLLLLVVVSLLYRFAQESISYWKDRKFTFMNIRLFFFAKKRHMSILIIHLGFIVLIFGLTGYGQQREYFKRIEVGEKIEIENYLLEFIDMEKTEEERNTYITCKFNLYFQEKQQSQISSTQRFHSTFENPYTSVGVISGWKEDFYLVLSNWSETGNVNIQVRLTPLVRLIWLGSYIIYGGFLLLILPKKL